jgi:hypothetical protein
MFMTAGMAPPAMSATSAAGIVGASERRPVTA